MIKKWIFLTPFFLVAFSFYSVIAESKEPDTEPPKELDGKGFFVLPQDRIRQLKVKSITTSDWLYKDDGTTTDRKRGAYVEYDTLGRAIFFSGHVDQKGYMELEYQYDDDNNVIEERIFTKKKDVRELALKVVYDYSKSKTKERVIYDGNGSMRAKTRYLFEDTGRILKTEKLDVTSGRALASAERKYDKDGNFVEEHGYQGRSAHSLTDNVLTVSRYVGPKKLGSKGQLHSAMEYIFDGDGNLQSYYRKSGDGSFWDRFTYELDERGLPVERVWSRYEFVLQEPYELTKYSYEYYE